MTYKELQEKAKKYNLPFYNIKRPELEASVMEYEAKENIISGTEGTLPDQPSVTPPVTSSNEAKDEDVSKKEADTLEKNKSNTIIILNGNKEIRRYTRETHGEEFVVLATEFAEKRGYRIKSDTINSNLICKNCGAAVICRGCDTKILTSR